MNSFLFNFSESLVNFLLPFLLGSLVFFAALVAPNTFKNLDEDNARKFIRSMFPKLYLWGAVLSLLIAILLFSINQFFAFLLLIVFIGFIYSRQFLMKIINESSDKKDSARFKKLHAFSVIIFFSQLLIMTTISFLV